jgi:hypothetical protein
MTSTRRALDERFAGDELDLDIWLPSYLPHWSSRRAAAAAYAVRDGELRLRVPPDHPLWCPETHEEPLRVSCVQTGNWSGAAGSTRGPQPFRPGLVVREAQEAWWGYTPRFGRVEATMRGVVSRRSMVAFWLSGIEDQPERSGEICVAEIFGETVRGGSAEVGIGLHAFRDPTLREDFAAERLDVDVAAFNTYGVEWSPGSLVFTVNGEVVRRIQQAPAYPVQLMIGVFDFPSRAAAGDDVVPELVVSRVAGQPLD